MARIAYSEDDDDYISPEEESKSGRTRVQSCPSRIERPRPPRTKNAEYQANHRMKVKKEALEEQKKKKALEERNKELEDLNNLLAVANEQDRFVIEEMTQFISDRPDADIGRQPGTMGIYDLTNSTARTIDYINFIAYTEPVEVVGEVYVEVGGELDEFGEGEPTTGE